MTILGWLRRHLMDCPCRAYEYIGLGYDCFCGHPLSAHDQQGHCRSRLDKK